MKKIEVKKIFILMIMFTQVSLFGAFTKQGNIVTDSISKLQWQDVSANNGNTMDWASAISYCENLSLDGFSDWRLPNIYELNSILHFGKGSYPMLPSQFAYQGPVGQWIWSSTTKDANYVYTVYVQIYRHGKTETVPTVRCVRGGYL